MNLGFHCILSIICIYLIQNRNCLRPSVNIACPEFNPSVPALVHHVFMCTFKDSINLKTPLFFGSSNPLFFGSSWNLDPNIIEGLKKHVSGYRQMDIYDHYEMLFFFNIIKNVLIVRDVKKTKWLSLLLRICNSFQYFFEVEKRKPVLVNEWKGGLFIIVHL